MLPKRIIIFGATGGTGRELVQQALDRGHQVTAFVRDLARLPIHHDRLRLIQGDVLKPDTLPPALIGQDAVLCVLGHKPFVSDPVCSEGTHHVLNEMARQGVPTIVVETALGVGDSFGRSGLFQKFLFRTLLRSYYADKEIQERHIRNSNQTWPGLNWTIVRPGRLTNGPATDLLRASTDVRFRGFDSPSVSRADVARFMLDQVDLPTFLHQCPTLY
ncbi:NAD(P)-dependent oxidoreductase [Spirosoma arcticum]